jgi:hypothetical protein
LLRVGRLLDQTFRLLSVCRMQISQVSGRRLP